MGTKASIFYVAYTRNGMKDPAGRPVTFSFNGEPGTAAVWVHPWSLCCSPVKESDPLSRPEG